MGDKNERSQADASVVCITGESITDDSQLGFFNNHELPLFGGGNLGPRSAEDVSEEPLLFHGPKPIISDAVVKAQIKAALTHEKE